MDRESTSSNDAEVTFENQHYPTSQKAAERTIQQLQTKIIIVVVLLVCILAVNVASFAMQFLQQRSMTPGSAREFNNVQGQQDAPQPRQNNETDQE
jgi:hypothetical protein